MYGEFDLDKYPIDPLEEGTYAIGKIYRCIKKGHQTVYYKGQWQNKKRSGVGYQISKDGSEFYSGTFSKDKKHGYGIYITPEIGVYIGQFN